MNRGKKTAFFKLKQDIERYLVDCRISSSLKLLFILDFWPVFFLRLEEWTVGLSTLPRVVMNIVLLFLRPLVQGMSGTRIFSGSRIGGGLLLHTSVGIIVTPKAVIGENCTLFAGASVVHKADGTGAGAPVIGDNVKLMNGCKVVGAVVIGDNSVVGANAVVLRDVPPGFTATGVPAIMRKKK
jgi:serine acetyltransferase